MSRILVFKATLGFWALAGLLGAADFQYPMSPFVQDLTLTGPKPVTNLYVAGRAVTVRTGVIGDLCAITGKARVESPVERDLEALTGSLYIENRVGQTVRFAAGRAKVDAVVGADLFGAAKNLTIGPQGMVRGDTALAGWNLKVQGSLGGRAYIAGGEVELDGPITGEALVRYEKSLQLGPGFRASGRLEVFGPESPRVADGAVAPGLIYHPINNLSTILSRWTAVFGLPGLIRIGAWLLAAWILALLFPKPLDHFFESLSFAKKLLWGALYILCALILVPVLLVTLIGSYLSLLLGFTLISLLLFARLLAVFLLAGWFHRLLKQKGPVTFRWIAGTVFLLHFLGLFPGLAWGCLALLTTASFGILVPALWKLASRRS
jgi:hypothetical protein